MANKYAVPVVLTDDGKAHAPGHAGQPLDPALIPLAPGHENLLVNTENGLALRAEDLISAEKNNPLAVGADKKLKADMSVVVAPGDPVLTVADNQLQTTLSVSLGSDGVLTFKGRNGQTIDSVTLPVIPGVPVAVEYMANVAPPQGSIVIGGVVGQQGNYLFMRFRLSNGEDKDVFIDYDRIHELKAGQGINISKDHTVSVKTKPGGGLSLTDQGLGLAVSGADSVLAPDGGLAADAQGRLLVDCDQMGGCIEEHVGRLVQAGAGLTLSSGALSVDFSGMPAGKKQLITPYLVQAGGGLVVGDNGLINVDFSRMPTDKFEALLKQIHVPIWMTEAMSFWVDDVNGSDVLGDGRGTENKPFKTITAAVQYATANYNTVGFYSRIIVKPGIYAESVHLGTYSATTGHFILESADWSNPAKIAVNNSMYNYHEGRALSVQSGKYWVVSGMDMEYSYNLALVGGFRDNWAQVLYVGSGATADLYGCRAKLMLTGSPQDTWNYNMDLLCAENATVNFLPSDVINRTSLVSSGATGSAAPGDRVSISGLFASMGSSVTFWGNNIDGIKADSAHMVFSGAFGGGGGAVFHGADGGQFIITDGYRTDWSITGAAATGRKYLLNTKAMLNTGGRGPNSMPGTVAGYVDSAAFALAV